MPLFGRRRTALAVFALMLLSTGAADAHHSIAGVYDGNRQVMVEGVVTRFRFVNPHPFLEIEVKDATGRVQPWSLEMDNRGELSAIGVTERTFTPGDRVVVIGSASRSQANALYVRKLERPADGFAYEQVGSSPRINR